MRSLWIRQRQDQLVFDESMKQKAKTGAHRPQDPLGVCCFGFVWFVKLLGLLHRQAVPCPRISCPVTLLQLLYIATVVVNSLRVGRCPGS